LVFTGNMATSKLQNRSSCPDGKGVVPGVCLLLAIAVFLVFGQTLRYGFINYDDNVYVYQNPQVAQGLTLHGIGWAFTHTTSNLYHPLTMMSLMLDAQAYGLKAGGYHLTNILLHGVTAILLFLVLRRMMGLRSNKSIGATTPQVGLRSNKSIGATTPQVGLRTDKSAGATATQAGVLWPSAFVAAVFAIHPLRVESVAWVTERKDMLSGLFFMLTLGAYVRYAQKRSKVESRESRVQAVPALDPRPWTLDYCLTLLFFTLGLLSKPTLVTLPFVLLLLDYWPLNRFGPSTRTVLRRVFEKFPLLLLAAASSIITFLLQRNSGTLAVLEKQSLTLRLENALVNYATYIYKMLWPENLAALYPYRAGTPAWEIVAAGGLLLFVTVLVVAFARRFPYLVTGWFWYLGMLVPMIGIVQAGFVTRADRFTYLPQIGLYLIMAWTIKDLTASWRYRRQILGVAAASVIAALMVCAWKQTSYWRDSKSLWIHTLACTPDNAVAHLNLGLALGTEGRLDEAIEHFQRASEISPNHPQAYNNLGNVLVWKGRPEDAIANFARAIQIQPDYAEAHNNLANMLAKKGQFAEAIAHYQKAIQLNPDYADAHYNLGIVLVRQKQSAEATRQFQLALQINPDNAGAHYNLGVVFGLQGDLGKAVEQYRKAIENKPDYADAHGNLANVLVAQGRLDEAVKEYRRTLELVPDSAQAHFRFGQALQMLHNFAAAKTEYQKVLELDPKHLPAHLSLAWLLATCPEASLRDGNKAVELTQQAEQLAGGESPQILDTLAAAYAAAGRFGEAVETAKRALNLSATQDNKPLAEAIPSRLKLYEAGSPYHEKP
jgi:tetratricopeptide (TPR) repeat protein